MYWDWENDVKIFLKLVILMLNRFKLLISCLYHGQQWEKIEKLKFSKNWEKADRTTNFRNYRFFYDIWQNNTNPINFGLTNVGRSKLLPFVSPPLFRMSLQILMWCGLVYGLFQLFFYVQINTRYVWGKQRRSNSITCALNVLKM